MICTEPEEPEIDTGNGIRVFKSDLNILKNPLGWLNAQLINAGQALLRTKFPNLGGLQDLGTCTFDEQIGDFVQALNCYKSHWILVSKMNCKINQVNVYDSSCTGDMPKEVIASLVKTHNKQIILTFPDVQQQTGGADCRLFVLAFAYTLCAGGIPEKMIYKQHKFKSHFLDCLMKKEINGFPVDSIMRVPSKPLLKTFQVYCSCCLPDTGDSMIK